MTLSNRLDPVNTESFGLHPISLDAHQWRNLTQCMAHGPVLLLYAPQKVIVPLIPSRPRTLTPSTSPTRRPATVDNTAVTTAHSVELWAWSAIVCRAATDSQSTFLSSQVFSAPLTYFQKNLGTLCSAIPIDNAHMAADSTVLMVLGLLPIAISSWSCSSGIFHSGLSFPALQSGGQSGPTCGRFGYITLAVSGVPNALKRWTKSEYGQHVGGLATSPLLSRGSPTL